ncbi:MAG: hypothetical protein JWM19_5223 [Actinomycetia bacterium]|nr:hypothetical protein [Actinomycetes bacterium]
MSLGNYLAGQRREARGHPDTDTNSYPDANAYPDANTDSGRDADADHDGTVRRPGEHADPVILKRRREQPGGRRLSAIADHDGTSSER